MKLSGRVGRARESGTARIAGIARRLAAEGRTIFNLSVGEPDFDTPEFVAEAARRAMLDGRTRYTDVAGTAELREAVASKFRDENSIECGAGGVIVGAGAKQLIFNAMLATLDPGDEVIVPAPGWVSYPDMALIGGGRPVVVACGAEAGFKIGAGELERAITPRSRWLILNSPGNPTGAVYSAAELGGLAAMCCGGIRRSASSATTSTSGSCSAGAGSPRWRGSRRTWPAGSSPSTACRSRWR